MCEGRAEWFGGWERTWFSPRPLRALPSARLSVSPAAARPPLRRPAAPTSEYLSDSALHNSASLSLALTSF